ncbi:hypothetical protein ANO14919_096760 [Xylariales sp. No.14919]|nr:hypothetical protein ANO14919_096760 [Xylariales sp. No.14919]
MERQEISLVSVTVPYTSVLSPLLLPPIHPGDLKIKLLLVPSLQPPWESLHGPTLFWTRHAYFTIPRKRYPAPSTILQAPEHQLHSPPWTCLTTGPLALPNITTEKMCSSKIRIPVNRRIYPPHNNTDRKESDYSHGRRLIALNGVNIDRY